MSKSKRSRSRTTVAKKRKKQSAGFTSLLIPIGVGVVVVAIIIGAIISIENRPPAANVSASVVTAQPGATNPIPYPEVPRISVQDTKRQLENGQAVVVDVRSRTSFEQSHIAGSISIPESEIDARLDELPRDKDVILYCT
jgi:cytoskeletal protein RodZ